MVRAELLTLISLAVSLVVGTLWIRLMGRIGGAFGAWVKRSTTEPARSSATPPAEASDSKALESLLRVRSL